MDLREHKQTVCSSFKASIMDIHIYPMDLQT